MFSYSGDTVTMTDSAGGVTVSKYNASGNLVSRTLSAPGEMPIGVAMGYTASGVLTGITRHLGRRRRRWYGVHLRFPRGMSLASCRSTPRAT